VTRVRIEDLPPKLRKQIEEKAGEGEGGTRVSARQTRTPVPGRGSPYRCHTCGATFTHYGAKAERHADEHGGARLEAIL